MASDEFKLEYQPDDVVMITMPTFSGSTDEFEIHTRTRPPLPFSRVNGSGLVADLSSPLLERLPIEIVEMIVSCLPKDSLSSFAAASRDCWFLARALQFEKVTLDYSDMVLFEQLTSEALSLRATGSVRTLSLGRCVRRLTVATSSGHFSWRHNLDLGQLNNMGESEKQDIIRRAADFYFGTYLPSLLSIIKYGLPNLELLEWHERACLNGNAWSTILQCPVRHLRLGHVSVDSAAVQGLQEVPDQLESRLETLSLNVEMSFAFNGKPGASLHEFAVEIIARCPNLKDLRWSSRTADPDDISASGVCELKPMQDLRSLSLSSVYLRPNDIHAILVPSSTAHLESLRLDFIDELAAQRLRDIGNVPTLRRFVWWTSLRGKDPPLRFLRSNRQIEQLSFRWCSSNFVDAEVLPLLAASFSRCSTLSLTYREEHITMTNEALAAIAEIKSLVKLHLSLGNSGGWRSTWLVNHKTIRASIRNLPLLKLLALSRDTYQVLPGAGQDLYEAYYQGYFILPRDDAERRLRDWSRSNSAQFDEDAKEKFLFEMVHRRRMLREAGKYVDLRYSDDGPKLEFIYFGEMPMRVKMGWHGWRAIAATERRDDLWTFLRRTFDSEDDLFDDG